MLHLQGHSVLVVLAELLAYGPVGNELHPAGTTGKVVPRDRGEVGVLGKLNSDAVDLPSMPLLMPVAGGVIDRTRR